MPSHLCHHIFEITRQKTARQIAWKCFESGILWRVSKNINRFASNWVYIGIQISFRKWVIIIENKRKIARKTLKNRWYGKNQWIQIILFRSFNHTFSINVFFPLRRIFVNWCVKISCAIAGGKYTSDIHSVIKQHFSTKAKFSMKIIFACNGGWDTATGSTISLLAIFENLHFAAKLWPGSKNFEWTTHQNVWSSRVIFLCFNPKSYSQKDLDAKIT